MKVESYIKRRYFSIQSIGFYMLALCLSCSSDKIDAEKETTNPTEETAQSKPNIVLIIADDMGLDASPGFEIGEVKPNLKNVQSMMDSGITFTNVWSNPTCAPTRAGILTGKYGLRNGVSKVGDVLDTSQVSLQKYIDDQTNSSYAQAVIGKWHLSNVTTHPNDVGVPYFAGFMRGTVPSYSNWDLVINGTTTTSTEYTTTKITDLAIEWVGEQTKPWFLWLAYNAPHAPLHLPPSNLHFQGDLPSDQASIDANPLPYYMAMLEAMDTEYGRFLAAMSEEEKANTIFIFIGDNGTPRNVIQGFGRSKAKETIYQGGIAVPMMVSGKGITRVNATEDALINTTDIFATIADITGASNTGTVNDSRSFKSLFTEMGTGTRTYNYSEIETDNGNRERTIRSQTHKYLVFADGTAALYNLTTDPLEENNLLNESGETSNANDNVVLEELKAALLGI